MRNLPRPTARGRIILLVGAFTAAAGAPLGFTDITRSGMFAVALVVLAWLVVLFQTARAIPVTRNLRDNTGSARVLDVGHTYTVDLFLAGSGAHGGTLTEHQSLSSDAPQWALTGRGAAYSYEVTPRHRGQFVAGPATFTAQDPLHLIQASAQNQEQHSWLVWPPVVEVAHNAPRYAAEGDDVISSPLAHYAGAPGGSLREYAQGDDMRIVHWPASAHRGELMVRQFDPPADTSIVLTFASGLEQPGVDAEWEWLISGAASLFVALLTTQVTTSIMTSTEESHDHEGGLDALAQLSVCQPPSVLPSTPTVLFAHSSTTDTPVAPHGVPALALVCGPQVEAFAADLDAAGWQSFIVDAALPVGEEMSYVVERLGVR